MPISQQGVLNTTALQTPDVYVQIVAPIYLITGVATNICGVVGTATWGPVNSPALLSGQADGTTQFGKAQARKFDLMTAITYASLQGANNFRGVRVTDGTDTAASTTITCSSSAVATALAAAINQGVSTLRGRSQLVVASASSTTLTLTAVYTGSLGNSLQANVGTGTAAGTTRLSIALTGQQPETYDNITGTTTAASATFTGGTDGATTITSATLIGQDILPRKGMYALRGTGASVAMLADADDSTQWTLQKAFGESEGIYVITTSPAGDTITNFASTVATAGVDSPYLKVMFGDWCLISDTVNNGIQRLISPQSFIAGRLAALSPEQSGLNRPLNGIIGTQKSLLSQQYSGAELQAIETARGDVIANPCPGGSFYGSRTGQNTSSNIGIFDDNYPRLTSYISASLYAGMGKYVGQLQGTDPNDPVRANARGTLNAFLQGMKDPTVRMIDGYKVILDKSNNSDARIAAGYMQADVMVRYLSVVRYFIINLQGGQTVQITMSNTPTPAFQGA